MFNCCYFVVLVGVVVIVILVVMFVLVQNLIIIKFSYVVVFDMFKGKGVVKFKELVE